MKEGLKVKTGNRPITLIDVGFHVGYTLKQRLVPLFRKKHELEKFEQSLSLQFGKVFLRMLRQSMSQEDKDYIVSGKPLYTEIHGIKITSITDGSLGDWAGNYNCDNNTIDVVEDEERLETLLHEGFHAYFNTFIQNWEKFSGQITSTLHYLQQSDFVDASVVENFCLTILQLNLELNLADELLAQCVELKKTKNGTHSLPDVAYFESYLEQDKLNNDTLISLWLENSFISDTMQSSLQKKHRLYSDNEKAIHIVKEIQDFYRKNNDPLSYCEIMNDWAFKVLKAWKKRKNITPDELIEFVKTGKCEIEDIRRLFQFNQLQLKSLLNDCIVEKRLESLEKYLRHSHLEK